MPDASSPPGASSPATGPPPEPSVAQTDPAVLEDLRARLRATRWPDAPEDAGWSLGTDLDYLRELVAYWADGFDWRGPEAGAGRASPIPGRARRPRDPLRARQGGRAGNPGRRLAPGSQPRLARLVLAL